MSPLHKFDDAVCHTPNSFKREIVGIEGREGERERLLFVIE